MAFSSNGNNFTPQFLGRPVSAPTQPNSAPTVTSPARPVTAAPTQAPVNTSQNTLNSILGNNSLTPLQKQQQIQAAGLGTMPIIYGPQSGSTPGTIAGGAPPPPPQFTPQFSSQVQQLYGMNPLNLLGRATDMNSAMNSINQNRAALGTNVLNNNGMGSAGVFSPVVTGTGQNASNPLSSLFAALNILGANRSNNYTS